MPDEKPVVHSDPEIMSGTPVFVGTRVPFETLLDYLEAGQPLSEFLEDFPTVSKEQAIAALEQAKEALLQHFSRGRSGAASPSASTTRKNAAPRPSSDPARRGS
ncbi:MAG: DUF433 domain-containing protein, partial [Deltaproteobacteria bacterium]|nr:DUF433 domain-containing protein [Deltaproteobacteria bacterium]